MPKKSTKKKTDLNLPKKRIFIGPASLWKRIAAFILDLLIIDFIILGFYDKIIKKLVSSSGSLTSTVQAIHAEGSVSTVIVMIFFLFTLFIMAYFILQEYMLGQTFGKMIMSLHTVSTRNEELTQITFLQSLIRSMFLIPTVPFIFLWIIDPVFYFFSKDKQRLSEWLSQSKVIEIYRL